MCRPPIPPLKRADGKIFLVCVSDDFETKNINLKNKFVVKKIVQFFFSEFKIIFLAYVSDGFKRFFF